MQYDIRNTPKAKRRGPRIWHENLAIEIGAWFLVVVVTCLVGLAIWGGIRNWNDDRAIERREKIELEQQNARNKAIVDAAEAKAGEEWRTRSYNEGAKYAKRFGTTSTECDSRAKSGVVYDLEQLEVKSWHAGCLSAASNAVPS